MATIMLTMLLGFVACAVVPWVATVNHTALHMTDLMAGDEGED